MTINIGHLNNAVKEGNVAEVVRLLKEVSAQTLEQWMFKPYFYSAKHNRPEAFEKLVAAGANFNAMDYLGRSAILALKITKDGIKKELRSKRNHNFRISSDAF